MYGMLNVTDLTRMQGAWSHRIKLNSNDLELLTKIFGTLQQKPVLQLGNQFALNICGNDSPSLLAVALQVNYFWMRH